MSLRASLLLALTVASGCDDDPAVGGARRWDCPIGWIPYARGGCGPALLLCAPGGGAVAGACEGLTPASLGGFRRLPDGGVGGAWPEPGSPAGPPPADWSPEGVPAADAVPVAGIPTCPPAWARRPDGTCDPALRADCPTGSFATPGGGCTATAASDCPAGDYADVRAEAGDALVLHVRSGADEAAADGSLARPYAAVGAALARATAGAWVVLAPGVYREALAARDVHLVGACAAAVTLTRDVPADATSAPTLQVGAGSVELRGVTIEGGVIGALVGDGGRLTLRDVVVARARRAGVFVVGGGRLVARGAAIVEGVALPGGANGHGLVVTAGASVLVERSHLGGNRGYGVDASGAQALVTLRDTVVRDTQLAVTETLVYGAGVSALQGASVTLERTAVAHNAYVGVMLDGAGSSLTARDLVVSDTVARSVAGGTAGGYGLLARAGARLDAQRLSVTGSRAGGVAVATGARAELVDLVVRGTRSGGSPAGYTGAGVSCTAGGSVRMTRARVEDNAGVGVHADEAGCDVAVVDGVIRGGTPLPDGAGGAGAIAARGASLTLTRVLVADNRYCGVVSAGEGSTATLREVVVSGTRPAPPGDGERVGAGGVGAWRGGSASLAHVRVCDGYGVGLTAGLDGDPAHGGSLTVEDTIVERITARTNVPGTPHDYVGQGLALLAGSRVEVTRALFADNARFGLGATGSGTELTVTDSVVRATGAANVAPRATYALAAWRGAVGSFTRVRVAGSRTSAAVFTSGEGSRVTLSDSVVEDTAAPPGSVYGGLGAQATLGARLAISRTRLSGSHTAAVSAYGAGTDLSLVDSAVLDTRTVPVMGREVAGVGLVVGTGAAGAVRGVYVADSHQVGAWAVDPGSSLDADDLLIARVSPLRDGNVSVFGVGLVVASGARATASRVAVVNVAGLALGAVLTSGEVTASMGARLTVRDGFVRGVSPAALRESAGARPGVAYGLHAADGCALDAARVVLDRGEWGFFQSSGALSLRVGVVTRQTRGAGASNGASPRAPLVLDAVTFTEVAGPVARDVELPEALLPPPPLP